MRQIRSEIPVVIGVRSFGSYVAVRKSFYDEYKRKIIHMITNSISNMEWIVENLLFEITITGSMLECPEMDIDSLEENLFQLEYIGRYPYCIHLELDKGEHVIVVLRHVHSEIPYTTEKDSFFVESG